MNYYNGHLSDISDIFWTFIRHNNCLYYTSVAQKLYILTKAEGNMNWNTGTGRTKEYRLAEINPKKPTLTQRKHAIKGHQRGKNEAKR